uniref:Ig-like domain-containing protein n=1 Tax=Equus asinus TaxID=9793 RepID=A0A9L0IV16_EQUAS
MVCVPPGPADVRFVWEKNGHELEMCVPVQTHALPNGRTHVLSWLRDAISESADYRCSALSSAGNSTSGVRVSVLRPEATHQKWTRELTAWRAVAGEHDRMMQSWRKAWVRGQMWACGWARGRQGSHYFQGHLVGSILPVGSTSFLLPTKHFHSLKSAALQPRLNP